MPTAAQVAELKRIKATNARRGPLGQYRLSAAARLNSLHIEANRHQKNIQHVNSCLSWSALAQRIGFEALFAAATLGAAGFIGRQIAARCAGRLGAAAAESGAAGRFLRLLARFGRASEGTVAAASTAARPGIVVHGVSHGVRTVAAGEAVANTLGRLSAASLRYVAEESGNVVVAGEPSKAPAAYAWGFCQSVLLAFAGRPGALKSGLTSKLLSGGAVPGNQSILVAYAGYWKARKTQVRRALQEDKALLALLESANATRDDLAHGLDVFAGMTGEALHNYALRHEGRVGRTARQNARRADYSGEVPFLARHTSNIANELKSLYADYSEASAKYALWSRILTQYNAIEWGLRQAKSAF